MNTELTSSQATAPQAALLVSIVAPSIRVEAIKGQRATVNALR
ncbi:MULTISPECIES: hypothetical protein [unclassified Pseudomonas]|nr:MULTISPECIES: hypothetical protein [unclassified Pseudomonas]